MTPLLLDPLNNGALAFAGLYELIYYGLLALIPAVAFFVVLRITRPKKK